MKLMEYEGRELLFNSGIRVPFGRIIRNNLDDGEIKEVLSEFSYPIIIKAQVLSGKRKKSGLINEAADKKSAGIIIKEMLSKSIGDEKVLSVLAVEKLDIKSEYYISYSFSTKTRSPVLLISKEGGIDIEEFDSAITFPIDAIIGVTEEFAKNALKKAKLDQDISDFLVRLYNCFKKNDLTLCEINPLIITKKGEYFAADFKGVLDDEALIRHNYDFPKRTGVRELTEMEKEAKKIDEDDYGGVAGKTFIEFDGDIAVLASGGGASVTAVDALISYGVKPANYTEYSGNPSAHKVKRLTQITLSKKGLNGCFVVGAKANFTRIDITLAGFLEALLEIKPKYPIVIRRDGPNRKEAFEMLTKAAKEHNLDIHLYDDNTPITKAASVMAELSRKYKEKNK